MQFDIIILIETNSPDHVFESGVLKIQRKQFSMMTGYEKKACERLFKDKYDTYDEETVQLDSFLMRDLINRKRHNLYKREFKRRNYDFIARSAGKVERLWSHAKLILTDNRKLIPHIVFESILFLKFNEVFWDQDLVSRAMSSALLRSE